MENNKLEFSYTNYFAKIESKGDKGGYVTKKISFEEFTNNTAIATSTMMAKREIVKNIKFTPTEICEDYFYKCQILKKIGKAHGLRNF